MSKLETNTIDTISGSTNLTLGGTNATDITIPSGVTVAGFKSTGIDDNATSTAITINSSEQVGIGTTSPASTLEISKSDRDNGCTLSITNAHTGTDWEAGDIIGTINFRTDDTSTTEPIRGQVVVFDDASGASSGAPNNSAMKFSTALNDTLSERMRIASGGGVNVGSGVLSAASGDGDIVVDLGIVIGTYNGDNRIAASSLGGGSATLYIGNAAIQVSSDERLKTNIADTTMSAVDKIKQVRIVDFNWNDPSDTSYNNRNARGTWTGVIAQELIDVFPFAVNAPRKEEDLSIDTESEKKWQVDQAHLVPVLMKAIQEQQTKIEELEARITALENA